MEGLKARIGIDCAPTTLSTYFYTHRSLGEFIKKKFKAKDIAFGQLNEQFIREYQEFVLNEQGYAMQTVRHYLAILKKICKIATSIYCRPEEWNTKKGIIKTERDNNWLTAFRQNLEQTYDRILKNQGAVSSELLNPHCTPSSAKAL